MTAKEIILIAANGQNQECAMNMADKLLYYQAAELYSSLRKGQISQEQGAEIKRQIIQEHNENSTKLYYADVAYKHIAELYKNTELCFSYFRKKPSEETAALLVDIVDGQVSSWKDVIKKIEEIERNG